MSLRGRAKFLIELVFMLFFICACSTVSTPYPLNDQPTPMDQEKFEGTWIVEGGAVAVRFADDGVGHIAGVEWEGGKFRLMQGELIVTEGVPTNYLSIRFDDQGQWHEQYALVRYKFTDQGELVLWSPDIEAFESAIEAKELKGAIEKDRYNTEITLTEAPDSLVRFMNDPKRQNLFNYQEPIVLRRIDLPVNSGSYQSDTEKRKD